MSDNPMTRRTFLASLPAGAAMASTLATGRAARAAEDAAIQAIYFPLSFLHCTPTNSGLLVRVQAECVGRVIDHDTGRSDEYVMGVVARTGLTLDAAGNRTPGYDYWIIFSDTHVFTRRAHASSYAANPTTLTHAQFGVARRRLHALAARELRHAADVRDALQRWLPLTAVTRFDSPDGRRSFEVEYPVKWADFGLDRDQFRVETGPVFLLDPAQQRAGTAPRFEDFQWAHLDYHDFEHVRCLLDVPTSIFTDATFTPPHEHGREARPHAALTTAQAQQIHDRLRHGWDAPLPPDKMDLLLSTDHYGEVADRAGRTRLFAFETGFTSP